MSYIGILNRYILNDEYLPDKQIPTELVNPLHLSWNDYERSCKKIIYQEKRWNPPYGHGCFLKINEEKQSIEFNMEHFKLIGKIPPEVYIYNGN